MTKMKKKWLSRALCGALAVALVSGTAIMSPVADIVGTNIIASAATYTGNVDASQLKNGDILKAGACVQGWLTEMRKITGAFMKAMVKIILSTVLLMMILWRHIQYTLRPQRS